MDISNISFIFGFSSLICKNNNNKKINYATNVCTPPKYAILDSGCTKHCVSPDTRLEKEYKSTVSVRMPDA